MRTKMVERYERLSSVIDERVGNGENALDPVIRSTIRQLNKMYKMMNANERAIVDWEDNIYFT